MTGERLVEIIKDASRKGFPTTERMDLVWGDVMALEPLQIQVQNEPKLLLTEAFLILSPLCLEKWFTIPEWHTNNDGGHTHQYFDSDTGDGASGSQTRTSQSTNHQHTIPPHTVMVWRGIQVGDTVIMLRAASGNKFYVLQREGVL